MCSFDKNILPVKIQKYFAPIVLHNPENRVCSYRALHLNNVFVFFCECC